MKYLQITPATSTEPGLCVQPTMEMPSIPVTFREEEESGLMNQYDRKMEEWEEHLKSIPKLPTTCNLPVGEWFDGEEQFQVYINGRWISRLLRDTANEYRWVIVPVEAYICVNCKICFRYLPEQCPNCSHKTFEKTHPSNVPVEQKDEPKGVPQDTLDLEEIYAVCSTEFGMLEFPWTEGEKGQARLLHFLRSQLTNYCPKAEAGNKGC